MLIRLNAAQSIVSFIITLQTVMVNRINKMIGLHSVTVSKRENDADYSIKK